MTINNSYYNVPGEMCTICNFILYCRFYKITPIKQIQKQITIISRQPKKNIIKKMLSEENNTIQMLLNYQTIEEKNKFINYIFKNVGVEEKKKILNLIIKNI